WPVEGMGSADLNDSSIALRLQYDEVSVLLAGDIGTYAEGRILANRYDLASTILKVAHHGSDSGTTNEFLQVVQPEFAVISVGVNNQYDHPSSTVLRRLSAVGAKVFRTDRDGAVLFTTNGKSLRVESER
ncbi:MAG: ComEC/Rec2 family competence protein, partial [Armatimonadota bacterium]